MSVRVAIDVGSSSGKIHYGWLDGEELHFESAHRFEEITTHTDGRHVWDVDHIISEIIAGLRAVEDATGHIDSLAIDTTAGDFGFLSDGERLADPYFFDDNALHSMEEKLLDTVSRCEIFEQTGHPAVPNSLYYQCRVHADRFEEADSLVTVPQLLSVELGADPAVEETFAMTLYCFDARNRKWAGGLLEALAIPRDVFPDPLPAGHDAGSIGPPYDNKLSSEPDILLAPSHDTSAAMAATPLLDGNRAFLCTGSWLIPGFELDEPIISDRVLELGVANELSVDGKIRLVQNSPGFGLLEDCRETWESEGGTYVYDDLIAAVEATAPHGPLIDPLDDHFSTAFWDGGTIEMIRRYCEETGQRVPESEGEITRCLLESLAVRSAIALEELGVVTGRHAQQVHLVGGGVRNEVFCQMVASAFGHPVLAGPIEATALGNVLSQMVATGDLSSYERGRSLVDDTFDFHRYEPQGWDSWDETVGRMRQLIN